MCGRRYIFKGATIRFTESRSSVLAVGRRSKKKSHKVRQKKKTKKKPECPSEETSAPNRRCTCRLWKSTPFYTPSIMMCFRVCGVTARSAKKKNTGLKTLKMLKKRKKKGKKKEKMDAIQTDERSRDWWRKSVMSKRLLSSQTAASASFFVLNILHLLLNDTVYKIRWG